MSSMIMRDPSLTREHYYARSEETYVGSNVFVLPHDYFSRLTDDKGRGRTYNGDDFLPVQAYGHRVDSERRRYPRDHNGAISRGRKHARRTAKRRERVSVSRMINDEMSD